MLINISSRLLNSSNYAVRLLVLIKHITRETEVWANYYTYFQSAVVQIISPLATLLKNTFCRTRKLLSKSFFCLKKAFEQFTEYFSASRIPLTNTALSDFDYSCSILLLQVKSTRMEWKQQSVWVGLGVVIFKLFYLMTLWLNVHKLLLMTSFVHWQQCCHLQGSNREEMRKANVELALQLEIL